MKDDEIGVPQHDLEAHIDGLRKLDQIRQRIKEEKLISDDGTGVPQHDLEVHIEGLRKLDQVRQRIKELRRGGNEMLKKPIKEAPKPAVFNVASFLDDGLDMAYTAWLSGSVADIGAVRDVRKITRRVANDMSLDALNGYGRSIEASGKLMQMLAASGTYALSRSSFLCWYVLIRELFSASAPDWSIGAARAGGGKYAKVSAYTTGHAISGILRLARSLDATADLLEELQNFEKKVTDVKRHPFPHDWESEELERLRLAHQISVKSLMRFTVLGVAHDLPDCQDLPAYTKWIDLALKKSLEAAHETVKRCVEEVRAYRKREEDEAEGDQKGRRYRSFIESATGHRIALSALERTDGDIEAALDSSSAANRPELAKQFRAAANRIRKGIEPACPYLRSVIDRELGAMDGTSKGSNPVELALAALAYSKLASSKDSNRALLIRALARVWDELGDDGDLRQKNRPFHTLDNHVGLFVSQPYVFIAIAQLMRKLHVPASAKQVGKIRDFFDYNKQESTDEKEKRPLYGWSFKFGDPPAPDEAQGTGLAILALEELEKLVDETINHTILEHFSVKKPDQISLDLDDLYYPDFGFRSAPDGIGRPSIAQQLQWMRRHIVLHDSKDPSFSLALYGPAGTGKTTLVEALAKSCGVPMVEVTPSDIAKRGEAEIEQKARAVFEALSMLTHAVVLFDEFDPILKRRSLDENRPFNMFSFLTPGMLPKLKNLHEAAKDNCTAYVLITNLIGTLDEAAIREGRFDEKYGIYPPDPVSRYGRFLSVNKDQATAFPGWRVARIVQETAGLGMTAMASRKGWFRPLGNEGVAAGTLTGYASGHHAFPKKMPTPEEHFKKELKGHGQHAEKEYLEWGWLMNWEEECRKTWEDAIHNEDNSLRLDEMMGWASTERSTEALKSRQDEVDALRSPPSRSVLPSGIA